MSEPIRWSRRARIKAWWRGCELPRTRLDAIVQHKEAVRQIVVYGCEEALWP